MAGRFRFSFPPRRHHDDPWFRIGTLDVTTTVLVALVCVVMIFVETADRPTIFHLIVWPDKVFEGQLWRLATWPFASNWDTTTLWTVVGIALYWYFGKEIEAQLGRRRFLVLTGTLVLVPGIAAALLVDQPVAGAPGMGGLRTLELCMFVLFVVERPNAPFFFGIPAWIIGAVFVGAELLDLMGERRWELLYVMLIALATALLVGRQFGLGAEQKWIPHLGSAGGRRKAPRRRGTSGPVVVNGPWAPAASTAMADQAEVDRLLDKISAVGMDGLTADEKRRLKEASERLRRERG